MDPSDLRIRGLKLGEAWFILADDEHKEQYRDSGRNPANSTVLEKLMQLALVDKLLEGTLQSYGMRTEPAPPSEFPELISRSLFTDDAKIDWSLSALRAYGRTYEGVLVIDPSWEFRRARAPREVATFDPQTFVPPAAELERSESAPPSRSNGTPPRGGRRSNQEVERRVISRSVFNLKSNIQEPKATRRGRPGLHSYALDIMNSLIAKNKNWLNEPTERQLDEFNKLMKKKYRNSNPPAHFVTLRTLNNYKNTLRKKLE
jgi:hypothetical protein